MPTPRSSDRDSLPDNGSLRRQSSNDSRTTVHIEEKVEENKEPLVPLAKKSTSRCDICNAALKAKERNDIVCNECQTPLSIHGWHLLKGKKLQCDGEGGHCTGSGEEQEGPIRTKLSSTAFRVDRMRAEMRELGICHGCMGTSRVENEYALWLQETRDERKQVESGLSKKKDDKALLARRDELNEEGRNYGRSAAHCIIPNQMLEWYSPMIVVSFYDIHDVEGATVDFDDSATTLLEIAEEIITGNMRRGTPEDEAQSFDAVMTALCNALHKFHLASEPQCVIGLLGAMRFAIAVTLRIRPNMLRAVTHLKSIAAMTNYPVSEKLQKLPHLRSSTPCFSPIINPGTPPEHGGGDPLRKHIRDVQSCDANIVSMTGQCRTPVFEVGKQCRNCEEEQGEDALLFRYCKGKPIGSFMTAVMRKDYGDNPWLFTVDFLKAGIDHFAKKFNKAYINARRGQKKQLLPFLQVISDNWLLFSLYYATCMLEGCIGLSPFRPAGEKQSNPCTVRRRKD